MPDVPPVPLFDVDRPAAPAGESAGGSRARRQRELLAAGLHPLTLVLSRPLRLHPEAAPHDDLKAPGRRCGNCRFRRALQWGNRAYPKCTLGDGARASHGAATDCRAWWSACPGHEYAQPAPEGAR